MPQKTRIGRRNFLKNSALGILAAGAAVRESWAGAPAGFPDAQERPSKVKNYRILGRTGFNVSDIGGGSARDEGLLRAMLEAGVNYFDTAESYLGQQKILGAAIKGWDRQSIFITSKMEVKKENASKENFLNRARKCLEELGTDYIDCMMMHLPEKVETLQTGGFHQAMEELKAEGKIRFVGVSHHGSFWFRDPEEAMDTILLAAAEDGRFDVFLFAYNFLQLDRSDRVLRACREKKIGVALMKTTPVAKYYLLKERIDQSSKEGRDIHPLYLEGLERFKEKADRAESFVRKYGLENPQEIKEAAVLFVLDNPAVNTVCCSAQNYGDLERFVRLSGKGLSDLEKEKLEAYREGCGELYCRHACGVCEPRCPHHVPVNTIMRYFHYFESQGREKYAMSRYAAIPGTKADVCSGCEGFCETACPYGVPIQALITFAHQELSLA